MEISFSKYQGAGNDFILIDDRSGRFPLSDHTLIQRLCNRHAGVGADGCIFLQTSSKADARMRIFNSDGREAEMCGNGLRCLIRFMQDLKETKTSFEIETAHGILQCRVVSDGIAASLGQAVIVHRDLNLEVEGSAMALDVVHTGVPHAVLFVSSLRECDVARLGKAIRCHPYFAPVGVNVNFAMLQTDGSIANRTFERGVEKETLACGTGAAAAAVAAREKYGLKVPICVMAASQDVIQVEIDSLNHIEITGPAQFGFRGILQV